MKRLLENWRGYLEEESQREGLGDLGNKLGGFIAKKWGDMDDALKKDHCEKKFPELLNNQGDIETFGELHALLLCTLQYKNRTKVLGILADFVPGVAAAKSTFEKSQEISDFVLGAYQFPDDDRPEGNLGKLDMDDEVSAIISDKVEKMFVKWLIDTIARGENLDREIPDDWDVTDQLRDYLAVKNNGRTVTGYDEED